MKHIWLISLTVFILCSCSAPQIQNDGTLPDSAETLSDNTVGDDVTDIDTPDEEIPSEGMDNDVTEAPTPQEDPKDDDSSATDGQAGDDTTTPDAPPQTDGEQEDTATDDTYIDTIAAAVSPHYFYTDSLPEYYIFAIYNNGTRDYCGSNQYTVEYYDGEIWTTVAASEEEYAQITLPPGGEYLFRNVPMRSDSPDAYKYIAGQYRINYNGIAYVEFSVKERKPEPDLKVEVTPARISLNDMPTHIEVKITNTGGSTYKGSRHCSVDYYNGSEWITVVAPVVIDEEIRIEPDGLLSLKIDLFTDIISEDHAYTEGRYRVNYNNLAYCEFEITTTEN